MRLFARLTAIVALAFIAAGAFSAAAFAAEKKIALLPWKVNSAEEMDFIKNAMADMLASRLGGSLEVVRPDLVRAAVGEKASAATDASALEAGRKLKADYVLYGSVTVLGAAVSVDARLVETASGKAEPFASRASGLDSIIGLVDRLSSEITASLVPSKAKAPAAPALEGPGVAGAVEVPAQKAQPQPQTDDGFFVKPDAEKEKLARWRSPEMEGMYVAMAAVDLDGDGTKELFLASAHKLTIASYGAGGFRILQEIEDRTASNLALDAVDADGDGAPELYLSRISGDKAASAVVEHRGGSYAIASERLPWLLRAVIVGKGAPVLAGQRYRKVDGMYGELKALRREGGRLVEAGPFEVELPRKTDIYSFGAFDFTGSGALDLVTLDDRGHLRVYEGKAGGKGWSPSYKSADFYGGTLNLIAPRKDPGSAYSDFELVPVEGRFFHADMDKDGRSELVIRKNTPGGIGRSAARPISFKTGEVISLSWDKTLGAATENWRTRQVEGYLSDFLMEDLDGDGERELTMLVVTGTEKLFGSIKTYVLSHRLSL